MAVICGTYITLGSTVRLRNSILRDIGTPPLSSGLLRTLCVDIHLAYGAPRTRIVDSLNSSKCGREPVSHQTDNEFWTTIDQHLFLLAIPDNQLHVRWREAAWTRIFRFSDQHTLEFSRFPISSWDESWNIQMRSSRVSLEPKLPVLVSSFKMAGKAKATAAHCQVSVDAKLPLSNRG